MTSTIAEAQVNQSHHELKGKRFILPEFYIDNYVVTIQKPYFIKNVFLNMFISIIKNSLKIIIMLYLFLFTLDPAEFMP